MQTDKQFFQDLEVLLNKRYFVLRTIADLMAKGVNKKPSTYYTVFSRILNRRQPIGARFLENFYRIFQADLDEIRAKAISNPAIRDEYLETLKEANGKLQAQVTQLVENNRDLALHYKEMVQLYTQLLAMLGGSKGDENLHPEPSLH